MFYQKLNLSLSKLSTKLSVVSLPEFSEAIRNYDRSKTYALFPQKPGFCVNLDPLYGQFLPETGFFCVSIVMGCDRSETRFFRKTGFL